MKITQALLALILFWSYGVCQAHVPDEPKATIMPDIKTIAEDASAFDGETVVLTGLMNECYPGVYESCLICDTENPDEIYDYENRTCLSVLFKHHREVEFARFATVRLRGEVKYNPPPTPEGDDAIIVASTGRKDDIINAIVEDVIIRRAPKEGNIPWQDFPPLKKANSAESVALKMAFVDRLSHLSDATLDDIHYAYIVLDDFITERLADKVQDRLMDESGGGPISSEAYKDDPEYKSFGGRGGVCICKDDVENCASIWPTQLNHTFLLPTDTPYQCWEAQKIDGQWKIILP